MEPFGISESTTAARVKIALVGNPNSGKSTLFNSLTGMNQRTGNFPGVTVDKKTGLVKLPGQDKKPGWELEFIDLPGTYSLYPKSLDEAVSYRVLSDPQNEDYPDITVVVADASNIKRNLFLVTQLIELRRPVILVLNMVDVMRSQGTIIHRERLSEELGIPVLFSNARKKEGIEELKGILKTTIPVSDKTFFREAPPSALLKSLREFVPVPEPYWVWQILSNVDEPGSLTSAQRQGIKNLGLAYGFDATAFQARESVARFETISRIVDNCVE
ncbi:MAG: FeoB small GTPase domain-containing protein, partial [Bacteroidia bacterium]